ncbi:hypothetical protein HZS_2109 [Henneguya salminicola]|nr:hypothetical protein HZS_2109 [Henneguya salminicola]
MSRCQVNHFLIYKNNDSNVINFTEDKKTQRKLKNRMSAQNTRDRKKLMFDELNKKVEILSAENESLRKHNQNLEGMLRKLVTEINTKTESPKLEAGHPESEELCISLNGKTNGPCL